MRHSEQENSHALPIGMSQWRQDVHTFVDEMQSDLAQMIDELSDTFSPNVSSDFSGSQGAEANEEITLQRDVENNETELGETRHDKP